MKNAKVIYTSLVGGYDELRQPLAVSADFDYVCFSDSMPVGRNGIWDIRPIPFKTRDKVLLSRYPKLLPHKVLPEYDYSVYMDANLQILDATFYDYINREIESGMLMAQVPHLERNCVYQELYLCWHKGMISLLDDVVLRYRLHRMGMPEDYGLMENNLIYRRHGNSLVKKICEDWWKAIRCGNVRRDQLLLMPILWNNKFKPDLLFGENRNARNVSFLDYRPHVIKRKHPSPKSRLELYLMRISNGAERRGWI